MQRLFRTILAHPGLVGVGIGEETAVVVQGDEFEVIGKRTVTVIDARTAVEFEKGKKQGFGNTRGVKIHSLRAGMKWRLERE